MIQYLTHTVPITAISLFFAFVWSCAFELPALKLEKILIGRPFGDDQQKLQREKKREEVSVTAAQQGEFQANEKL